MDKIELKVVGLTYSQTQTGAYALVLKEVKGNRRLPIIIGGAEAQAIAIPMEQMTPSRPLTHDLLKSFLDNFGIEVEEVVIFNLREGIFYAKILCRRDGNPVEIDSRSSDAVALALRCGVPIYTHDFILSSAGIVVDEEDEKSESSDVESGISIEEIQPVDPEEANSVAELKKQLDDALAKEDYEKASRIRDEINRRKKK